MRAQQNKHTLTWAHKPTHMLKYTRTPFHPPGASTTAIALGMVHTCIIATGGGAKCWGYNGNGQLGIGSTSNAWSPVDVQGALSPLPWACFSPASTRVFICILHLSCVCRAGVRPRHILRVLRIRYVWNFRSAILYSNFIQVLRFALPEFPSMSPCWLMVMIPCWQEVIFCFNTLPTLHI